MECNEEKHFDWVQVNLHNNHKLVIKGWCILIENIENSSCPVNIVFAWLKLKWDLTKKSIQKLVMLAREKYEDYVLIKIWFSMDDNWIV